MPAGIFFFKQVNRSKLTLKKLSSLVIVKYSRELFKFTSQKELLIEQFIIDNTSSSVFRLYYIKHNEFREPESDSVRENRKIRRGEKNR